MRVRCKKLLLSTVLGFGMLVCAVGGSVALQAKADDAAQTAPELTVTMSQNAYILDAAPMGIRFEANVANADAISTYYGEENVIYGMLITPADYITATKPLEMGVEGGLTEYVEGTTTEVKGTYRNELATLDESGNIKCSFIGIIENNYSRPFAARAYIGVKAEGATEYTYTYSDICARSVYTVASYPVALENVGYSDEVMTYLNGIVDKVHETYTTLNVDLGVANNVFDGTNNTGKITATVSNGTRNLETGVKITSDTITVTGTDYKVNALGDLTATATVGERTATINETSTMVCASNDDVHVTTANKNATAKLEKVDAQGRTGVLHWYTEADSCTYNASTLNIDGPFTKANMERDDVYLTFDFWTKAKISLIWYGYPQQVNLYDTDDTVKYYNEEGYQIDSAGLWTDEVAVGRWITIQVKIPDNTIYYSNNQYEGFAFASAFSSSSEVYLDNIRLTTQPMEEKGFEEISGTILADQSDIGNIYPYKSEYTALNYVDTNVGGRSGVFKWEAIKATEDGKPLNGDNSKLTIKNTSEFADLLKKDYYISFDFYTDKVVTPTWTTGGDFLLYNYTDTSNASVKLYDEDGFAITGSSLWLNSSMLNTWITYEVKLGANYPFNQYCGLSMWASDYSNFKYGDGSANVYIDNFKVSNKAIEGKTTGTEGTILANESDLSNIYAHNSSLTSISYVEEGANRTGVFKWSTKDESDNGIGSPNATLRFAKTRYTEAWLKKGSYIVFDMYVDKTVRATWNDGSDFFFYSKGASADERMKVFDEDGNLITSGSIWTGEFLNKWVTFEIKMNADYNFDSAYGGFTVYAATPTYFNSSANVYLDNVRVSTTSMATTAE